ncbi:hypothetical protein M9458_033645, partial [Cirrhinus mrigala]
YFASQRSSGFQTQIIMDPASHLFCLRQGNRPIEDYVVDFCKLCHLVNFNDVALKDIFRAGLSHPIRSGLPGGKIHWSLEQYIDFALLLAGSPFTVGIADEGPRNPTVISNPRKPVHTKPAAPGSAHAIPARPESASVMAALLQPAHKMAAISKPVHKVAAIPEPAHKMAAIPEPAHKMAAIPKPVRKMAAITKPVHKMAALSESLTKMAAPSVPHQVRIISSKSHLTMSAAPKSNQ